MFILSRFYHYHNLFPGNFRWNRILPSQPFGSTQVIRDTAGAPSADVINPGFDVTVTPFITEAS